ncbi:hypothetical protein ER308_14900 [Egibacter rhizosphaerae]|uniref:Uncharacterized protein n=1 Tax=Egibacter rhizosphaerae TaxID=1670831 RepID=A0A411YI26_9ACTN|nr:PGPGW domain-containing protein [Egibacter rhizosphaerae]QBI20722.1 hypothetical protein ER308_14900 [Egibacter rhizosphaerae]
MSTRGLTVSTPAQEGPIRRLRERLVLRAVRPTLDSGEGILDWGHVQSPSERRHGLLVLTDRRCLLSWAGRDEPDVGLPWEDLIGVETAEDAGRGPVLTLATSEQTAVAALPASSKARASRATRLLERVGELADHDCRAPEVQLQRRGLRGHTRRVGVTVAGLALLLVSAAFASPVVPGPGALTALAALALLATEYDWARDLYHWFRTVVESVRARYDAWRERRASRSAVSGSAAGADATTARAGVPGADAAAARSDAPVSGGAAARSSAGTELANLHAGPIRRS